MSAPHRKWVDPFDGETHCNWTEAQHDAFVAENKALREALRTYGDHLSEWLFDLLRTLDAVAAAPPVEPRSKPKTAAEWQDYFVERGWAKTAAEWQDYFVERGWVPPSPVRPAQGRPGNDL